MNAVKTVRTPSLQHDAMMKKQFGTVVSVAGKIERRIVANLCAHLAQHGFEVCSVYDGEELCKVSTCKAAMELIFNLDEASLRFIKEGHTPHGVYIVLGNGGDVIADWNSYKDDRDGFNVAMEAFDSEKFM